MSSARVLSLLLLVLALSAAGFAQADATQRHNPFERFVAPLPSSSNSGNTASNFRLTHPRLRAVLHATDGSLANLEGHVLAQGETALGYTLLAVQDHSAKFRYRQRIITLQVTEDTP